jgi:hypothetical protein
MRVKDSKEAVGTILPIHNDILRASDSLSITNNNNSYLPDSGIRKIIASPVAILIKVE